MAPADPCVMFQPGRRTAPSFSPNDSTKKRSRSDAPVPSARLSDEEMRQRIFSNAAVLFPSSNNQYNAYEIVYGSRPRLPTERSPTNQQSQSQWQYAMLVRRNPSGDFTPLIRGMAWSSDVSWGMVLQGLLDTTAAAIHKKLGAIQVPPLGVSEELPRYSPMVAGTQ